MLSATKHSGESPGLTSTRLPAGVVADEKMQDIMCIHRITSFLASFRSPWVLIPNRYAAREDWVGAEKATRNDFAYFSRGVHGAFRNIMKRAESRA
jgi:hypothetical protein